MKICLNPSCGEPIESSSTRGMHPKCYEYHRKNGVHRPLPASIPLPNVGRGSVPTLEALETQKRTARGVEHRRREHDARFAWLEMLMPKKEEIQ